MDTTTYAFEAAWAISATLMLLALRYEPGIWAAPPLLLMIFSAAGANVDTRPRLDDFAKLMGSLALLAAATGALWLLFNLLPPRRERPDLDPPAPH